MVGADFTVRFFATRGWPPSASGLATPKPRRSRLPGRDRRHAGDAGRVQNVAIMRSLTAGIRCLAAAMLLAAAPTAGAQNIYKCTQGGQVAYTDHPCPNGSGELLHQADDTEVIDRYLRLGQDELAKRYAQSRHLEALYQQRVDARQQAMDEKAQRDADEAYAAQQRAEEAQQQALADQAAAQAADRDRLQAENAALRQQNADYQNQLSQPVYNAPPAYWIPPYPRRHRDHDGDHGQHPPPVSDQPIFHPCKQLAGGRTQC